MLRRSSDQLIPDGRMLTLSFAGVGLLLFTAWLGGELVYRLGIGVDPDANINAPSSLTIPPDLPSDVIQS